MFVKSALSLPSLSAKKTAVKTKRSSLTYCSDKMKQVRVLKSTIWDGYNWAKEYNFKSFFTMKSLILAQDER